MPRAGSDFASPRLEVACENAGEVRVQESGGLKKRPRPRKPPAHVHSEAETQFAAARREKGTTVRRIARNSPMGSASSCSKMIGERARESEKMAATGNFESPLALSFAH
jgi:hypothetical protein